MQQIYTSLSFKALLIITVILTTALYFLPLSKKIVRNEKTFISFRNLFTLYFNSIHKFFYNIFTSQSRIVNYFLAYASCQGTGGGGGGGGHGGVATSTFPDYDIFQDSFQDIKTNNYKLT